MKTDRLDLRIQPSVKAEARVLAKKLGVSMSLLVESCLRQIIEDDRRKSQPTVDAEQI